MDREIEFKAKRVENGEWVKGFYVKQLVDVVDDETKYKHYIVATGIDNQELTENGTYLRYHKVLPETVGQYIGKKDVSGQKIYEGDIVDWEDGRGKVWFNDGQFVHTFAEKISGYETFRPSKRFWNQVKVIGNEYEEADKDES